MESQAEERPTECAGYRLGAELGRGGSGVVYAGARGSERAAIKLLHRGLTQNRQAVARFFHEARSVATIRDPGMVHIYDAGQDHDGRAFIVMELLEGESLAGRIARPPRAAHAFLTYVGCEVARTLGKAHALRIVHRDLKPDNLYLARDRTRPFGAQVKVLDFGMAKLDPEAGPYSFVTDRGALVGTPVYMSPEQCRGGEVDARSDVYALGCVLYELACGRPPFIEGGLGMILGAHVYQPVRRPREFAPTISTQLEQVLLHALEKDPAHRPPTMDVFATALASAS